MEREKRADGDVAEMPLAGVEVVDQIAARRRLGGLGRPWLCIHAEPCTAAYTVSECVSRLGCPPLVRKQAS
jgi:hypothetical protein